MTEKEIQGLTEVFVGILIRHSDNDKKLVAQMLVDMVVESYEDTEGRTIN